MNQLRSEFESGSAVREAPIATAHGPVLSDPRVDRLLAEPPTESSNPPPMHGIWLGVAAGILMWAVLALAFVLLG
jgi:hypothetical protein